MGLDGALDSMRAQVMVLLILLTSLSGCFGEDEKSSSTEALVDDWGAYTIVSPIDTGINVYHNHFRWNGTIPQWLLDAVGVTQIVDPTLEGSYSERFTADTAMWDNISASDTVWFRGTRIMGTSPDWSEGSGTPILDDPSDGHGSAVTGAVLNANPDALIFFVEGFSDNAVLAAANNPMVDILTTSFGPIGSIPVPGIEDATRVAVVENGKMHTGAADNSPSPAVQDATAGPPWSIGVSGYAEEDDDQKETMSGSYPDVAGDWTQVLPNHQDIDGYHQTSGTSFATPRTAGLLSKVILQLRVTHEDMASGADPSTRAKMLVNGSDGFNLGQADIRDGLNLTGWYPSFSTWDPTSGTTPMSPVAPCTQVGWGVVNESNVEPLFGHLNGTDPLPNRPSDVVFCMDVNQQARYAYWGD
ncbi:MAG TPA: hypothetical protein EYQ80_01020 [Candidatus Poseidoniales archaeon]|nr:hypothetical protein [Candidatus Poseidoniales archaeon]